MRQLTQAATRSAILFSFGCGASAHEALKEEPSGESARVPEKEITIDLGDGITLEMALIPAGEFVMGSPDPKMQSPQHRVLITRPFYLGKYPVTQQQWVALTIWNPSGEPIGRRKPVERVSWKASQRFIDRLNEGLGDKVGKFGLPTDAQWEYACRAGTTTRYSFGDDAARLGEYARYANNASGTRPVGQKKPNPWGLYDMHGNVYEWCADWYAWNYYAKSPLEDPVGPSSGREHVFRGGGWDSTAAACRSAARDRLEPPYGLYKLGFRVALVAMPAPRAPLAQ